MVTTEKDVEAKERGVGSVCAGGVKPGRLPHIASAAVRSAFAAAIRLDSAADATIDEEEEGVKEANCG